VLRRLAARAVTGPVAFFLAAVIDVGVLALASLWRRRRAQT
jgi:hypothetical protein